MDLILNERQYKKLILESSQEKYKNQIENNKSIIKKVVRNSKRDFNLDTKFILTWSVPIGGLIGPVYDAIHGEMPNLDERELVLITLGTILSFFYENSDLLKKVLILIRDNGLINEFNRMLSKTENLKNTFLDFLTSIQVTINPISNVLSFTFFLNVLNAIYELTQKGFDSEQITPIILGLIGYFGVKMSTGTISEVTKKMIERFKGK
jgi:hypothetical protein